MKSRAKNPERIYRPTSVAAFVPPPGQMRRMVHPLSPSRWRITKTSSSVLMEPHRFWIEDGGFMAFYLVPPKPTTEALSHSTRVDNDASAAEASYKDGGVTPSANSTPRFGSPDFQ